MAAGDLTVGFISNIDELDSALTTAGVTLVGKPSELQIVSVASGLQWFYIEQA